MAWRMRADKSKINMSLCKGEGGEGRGDGGGGVISKIIYDALLSIRSIPPPWGLVGYDICL